MTSSERCIAHTLTPCVHVLLTRSAQVDVPVYALHSLGDLLCEASATKHFQTLHSNPMSTFVYPEHGKHELLQETDMWKVGKLFSFHHFTIVLVLAILAYHNYLPPYPAILTNAQSLLSEAISWIDWTLKATDPNLIYPHQNQRAQQ